VDELLKREQYYLDFLNPEFNILKTADSLLGFRHSDETKQKISKRMSGKNNPMFGITGSDHHSFGKPVSAETREKIATTKRGELNPMFGIIGSDHHSFGKTYTQETKDKIATTKGAYPIYVWSEDKITLIATYRSITQTAKGLGADKRTITKYINSDNLYRKKYYLTSTNPITPAKE
jgi:group I intron endonuclease